MLKQLLIDTLPAFNIAAADLQRLCGIDQARLQHILDCDVADDVTRDEYMTIMKALPVSLTKSLKQGFSDDVEVVEDLEYLSGQIKLLGDHVSDEHFPICNGMRRLLSRLVASLS